MKIVYSQWSLGKEPFKEMVACSNRLAQAHGFETILYTDEKGKEDLKNIKFSEVRLFPDIINDFPKNIWSLGKILAMSLMDEPFYHIDQDILMYKNILKDHLDKDFLTFHDEPWSKDYLNLCDLQNNLKIHPEQLNNDYEPISHNFAVIGGQKYKEISEASTSVIDCCLKNKKILNEFDFKGDHNIAVMAEQVWISAILKNKNITPSFILKENIREDAKKLGVAHFWTGSKVKYRKEIINYAKKLGVSY
jgi:hypothetical protein